MGYKNLAFCRYGSRLFEATVYTQIFKSHGLGQFCSGGFQPAEEKNINFSEFRRNETFKYAEPMALKCSLFAFFGGLKPTATKLTEPTALLSYKDVYKP